jgi:hypothetical protein
MTVHLDKSSTDPSEGSVVARLCANWPIIVITVVGAILILANLGQQSLWQDEAQTALLAKTVIHHGIPLGTDGVNSFSQAQGKDFGPHHLLRFPLWLQCYALAPFLALLGSSAFAARLPFALFGIVSIWLVYALALYIWRSCRIAVVSALLLVACVPYLLLVRQCRYYSLSIFFSMLALWGYYRLLRGEKYALPTIIGASFLVFHSHYLHWAALTATMIIDSLIFDRRTLKPVLVAASVTTAVNLPWIVWFYRIPQQEHARSIAQAMTFLGVEAGQIAAWVLSPYLLAVPILAGAIYFLLFKRHPERNPQALRNLSPLILFSVIAMLIIAPTAYPMFRYLAPLVPICCMFIALLLEPAMKVHVALGIAVIAVIVYLSPIQDFGYEITHEYRGPIDGIVKYLNEHAKKTDIVAMTYGDMPVKFYTGLRVVGGLTGEDLSISRNAEWIILREHYVCDDDIKVGKYFTNNIDQNKYEQITLDYPDTKYENRESLDDHHFRTVELEQRVVIYHRREDKSQNAKTTSH